MLLDIDGLFRSFSKDIMTKESLNKFIKLLEEKVNKVEDDLKIDDKEYTVDRFEGNIAVCEDRDTKEMKNIERKDIPISTKEGDVLILKNGEFRLSENQADIEERIKDKMNRLWN